MRPLLLGLLSLLAVLLEWTAVKAQAPDDYDDTCRRFPNDAGKDFPADLRLLLDSSDYLNLFGTDTVLPAIWLRQSFDGDDGSTPLNNWVQDGGACSVVLNACTFRSSTTPQNNWIFTHYISYRTAVQVFMNVTYDFRLCVNAACLQFVTLYKYDTDGIVADSDRMNRNNYRPLFGTEEASQLQKGDSTATVTKMLSLTRTGNREGFYLAFRDTGTCASVQRVLLYYRFVAGRSETFLQCPDVALPVAGSGTLSSLSCTCVNTTAGVGSLERACDQDGVCNEDQRCECDAGFGYNSTVERCLACPVEAYKAGVSNSSCQPCPALSEARNPGAAVCECIPPNSRGGGGPEQGCRDMRFPTSSAVAITFFVTFLIVGVVAFLGGSVVAYLCRKRIEKVVP